MPVRKHESKVKRVRPRKGGKVYVSVHEAQQLAEAIDIYGARLADTLKGWAPSSRAMFVGALTQLRAKFVAIGGGK